MPAERKNSVSVLRSIEQKNLFANAPLRVRADNEQVLSLSGVHWESELEEEEETDVLDTGYARNPSAGGRGRSSRGRKQCAWAMGDDLPTRSMRHVPWDDHELGALKDAIEFLIARDGRLRMPPSRRIPAASLHLSILLPTLALSFAITLHPCVSTCFVNWGECYATRLCLLFFIFAINSHASSEQE